jgi:hypothetical protein
MRADRFRDEFKDVKIAVLGEGLVYYSSKFAAPNTTILDEKYWMPSAAMVHRLGLQKALQHEYADPLTLTPKYVQPPDAVPKKT